LLKQLGLPDVVNSGSDMVDEIAAGVNNNSGLETAAENLIKTAKSTAVSAVASSRFDEIGKAIVQGVYKGISDNESWFRSQVTSFFKRIVDQTKKSLGIASPSKVFAEIGKNMAEGVGEGFAGEMDKVADAMQDAMPTDFDLGIHVDPGLNIHSGSSGIDKPVADSRAKTITQHISITSPMALSEKEAAREFKNLSRKLALEI
ncbi:MAG: hypothetical protein FWE69_08415, partial [Clostridiales bacterium]|nr:hypothetical protein [Clostridiales bacterium]